MNTFYMLPDIFKYLFYALGMVLFIFASMLSIQLRALKAGRREIFYSVLILIISAFSFLGMGFSSSIPEWGGMLTQGKAYFYSSPSLIIFPGLCILFTTTGFNLLSEGLKEYLES